MDLQSLKSVYFRIVRSADAGCSPRRYADLLGGLLGVHSMVRVMPWLEDDFGRSSHLASRIKKLSESLLDRIGEADGKAPAALWTGVMEAAWEINDGSLSDRVWRQALDTRPLRTGLPAGSESETARFLCSCICYARDDGYESAARGLIRRWQSAQDAAGAWPRLPLAEAANRLAVMSLFDAVSCGDRCSESVRKGGEYYLSRFPEPDGADAIRETCTAFRLLLPLVPFAQYRDRFDCLADRIETLLRPSGTVSGEENEALYFSVSTPYVFETEYERTAREPEEHVGNELDRTLSGSLGAAADIH